MLFVKEISTPANTTEKNFQETPLGIPFGIIHRVIINFPPGPAWLLHVQIWRGGLQLFPTNYDEDFAGDDVVITFRTFESVERVPTTLTIRTWNDDDTFAHRMRVSVGVLPKEILIPELVFGGILGSLRALLRRVGVIR